MSNGSTLGSEGVGLRLRHYSELHRDHPTHPGSGDDLVSHRFDVLYIVLAHQVCGTMNFDNGLILLQLVVSMLQIKREGLLRSVLEENLAEWSLQEVIDSLSLYLDQHRPQLHIWLVEGTDLKRVRGFVQRGKLVVETAIRRCHVGKFLFCLESPSSGERLMYLCFLDKSRSDGASAYWASGFILFRCTRTIDQQGTAKW